MTCEKCWSDAYWRMLTIGRSQGECYYELIKERENHPCTLQQQAGEYWDEEMLWDKREHTAFYLKLGMEQAIECEKIRSE